MEIDCVTMFFMLPFSRVIGHQNVIRILRAGLENPAPAYVFTGPRHIGKRTMAREFSAGLLGVDMLSPQFVSHPDLIELSVAEGKKQISVDQVRDARERISMRPSVASRSVVLILHATALNDSGSNALLKFMEEPPAGAVFILVADEIASLPQTVQSRSVILQCSPVSIEELKKDSRTSSRAETCRGRAGYAIRPSNLPVLFLNWSQKILEAKMIGERIAILETLSNGCDRSDDPMGMWIDALDAGVVAIEQHLNEPKAFALGVGLATARASIGSAISPRWALEASIMKMDEDIRGLIPNVLPSSLPMVYNRINI